MIKREDFFKIRTKEDWNEQASKFADAGIRLDKEMLEHLEMVLAQYEFSTEEIELPNEGFEINTPSFLRTKRND